jgi:hypothetical protein
VPVNNSDLQRHDDRYGAVRVTSRSRLFYKAPLLVVAVLSVNFVWDVIRINAGPRALAEWPLRFNVLDVSTTATVLAVFVALFMGRLQWARTLSPHIGSAIDDKGAAFRLDSDKWRLWVYNAGPGAASINEIRYHPVLLGQRDEPSASDWLTLTATNDRLRSLGLIEGADYFIRWLAAGSPLPVLKHYTEGRPVAWFTVKALSQLSVFDIRIRYSDLLGDSYENVIPVMHRLPSIVVSAVEAERAKSLPIGS